MSTMHCPICDSTNLTQEGLTAKQISKGYWRCLDCGNLVRPFIMPDRIADAEAESADQPADEG